MRTGISNRLRGGADFYITPSNTLTAAILLANDNQLNTTHVNYSDYWFSEGGEVDPGNDPPDDQLAYYTRRTDVEEEDEIDIEFSLNYEKKFTKKDHKFTAYTHYIRDAETEKSNISQTVESFNIANTSLVASPQEKVLNEESETNFLLQADYVYPFGDQGMFEAGYRSEFRTINNPYYVDSETESGYWERLAEYSNNFEYVENIHGLYVQAGNGFGKFSTQAGLRIEASDVRTYLHETDSANERLYFDFFPSLHTSFQFSPVHSAQLSYSRRIHRPHFWFLNPFYSYTDPRNFRSGNPNLDPEYTHSVELGYLFKQAKFDFYTGIYYRYTTDVMQRVSEVDETTGITVVAPQNLDNGQSFGFETNASLNLVSWWTLSGDFNFYRYILEGNYDGEDLSSDDYSWNTRFNSKFKLPYDIDAQVIFFYRAPRETAQGIREEFYMMNAAVSKDIFKGKGTLTFNVRDVLNSRKFSYILDQETLYSLNEWHRSQRRYNLTLIYRLNQNKRMGRNGGNNGGNGNNGLGGDEMGF